MKEANYTFWSVIAGLAFLLIVFAVSVITFRNAPNPAETVVAVLGAVTGVVGTLVGYVAGQSGKDRAQARALRAERRMAAVLDTCGPGTLEKVRTANPDLF
jgi:hypothetical protein